MFTILKLKQGIKLAILGLVLLNTTKTYCQDNRQSNDYLKIARELAHKNPDSSAFYFNKKIEIDLKSKDTISAIQTLNEVSILYSHNLNYSKSYDGYWKALLLADKIKNNKLIADIYQEIGWLYSFYKRDDKALEYFNKSIKLRKKQFTKNESNAHFIASDYFSIVNLHRGNKDYKKAAQFLDSCKLYQSKLKPRIVSYYIIAEEAYLDAVSGNYNIAIDKLNQCKEHFKNKDKTYLSVIHSLTADVYKMKKEYDKSIANYKISIQLSENNKSHLNYKLKNYEGLKDIYVGLKNYKEAYYYLNKENTLNNKIFGITSENSKHLLEIKDNYRLEKEKQEDALQEQLIANYEQEDKIWLLKSIILIILIISLLFYGFVLVKQIKNKHKNEKQIIAEKQKLKTQKTNEVLELKNKELTQAALRLIEKDEFIAGLHKKIETAGDNVNKKVILRALKTFQGTPSKNWTEFEARFTTINQSFYENLRNKYPKLSQTDQKICALVRLNFPSKDMSKLLGISVESVHTSRYRLRKKLGLKREDNLEDFISRF
ncbi:tetratricopeptide repeat protein [Cellulophaga omnivescoria]|uniref:tetratricopeptide repeat protein n=1 Tax=Cellulophaga omnivescoria TaxID=1888890 RepID=UPI00098594B4|nr:tetratricopeptide repeat protein [Cellulophaga omnivescoria]WBU88683.1 tetratricopeptide repeat protein [Cellulophaga omnivescoria]WKB80658.1 tetratricopeptide repeat protein [Cellulophaga lytica]